MPEYRRSRQEGGTFFFTVVTYGRYPYLRAIPAVRLFEDCVGAIQEVHPFVVRAQVILPDHVHAIWTLPTGDSDFSIRWKKIKSLFTRRYSGRPVLFVRDSLRSKGEGGIWQRRFWEHCIRDEDDLAAHLDYIHYNPVKHGLAALPTAWPHSTFAEYVKRGLYEADWGSSEPGHIKDLDLH